MQRTAFSTGVESLGAEEIEWVKARIAQARINGFSGLMGLPEAQAIPLEIEVSLEFNQEASRWFVWVRGMAVHQELTVLSGFDQACEFIMDFLACHRQHDVHCFGWASWNDRPRLEAFLGGAACISAEAMEKWSMDEWAMELSEMMAQ